MSIRFTLLLIGASLAMPLTATAQSADVKYCAALIDKYQRQNIPAKPHVTAAVKKCKAGQTAEAMPVLEAALLDANVDLPPRTTEPAQALGAARGAKR